MSLARALSRLAPPPAEARLPSLSEPRRMTTTRFGSQDRHGRALLAGAVTADPARLAALAFDDRIAQVDLSRALLLDTETTGLAGGTGTLPFLIGLGQFGAQGELTVEQLFLRRPGEERPMLERLAASLAEASCLVTYNGKSFDWPLLQVRYVMNRMVPPVAPVHLDLLHCARRVFRHRGAGARLGLIERDVLGHQRVGDVPGFAIPELYFSYLEDGRFQRLQGVLEHNVHDVALLAALIGELSERFAGPRRGDDARDLLGCAEVALRGKDNALAEAFALAAREGPAWVATRAWRIVARVRVRTRRQAQAASALERALETASAEEAPELELWLAKLSEHALKDAPRALSHACEAAAAETAAQHGRRISRLRRKVDVGAGHRRQREPGP